MKKGIFFQFIVIIFFLILWNLVHLGYEFQKNQYHNTLSSEPMILVSQKLQTIQRLNKELDSLDFISNILIESDTLVAQKIIKKYSLKGIQNILSSFKFPNAMKIYFHGQRYGTSEKQIVENKITKNFNNIILNYNHTLWKNVQTKLDFLKYVYYIVNGLIVIIFIILSTFLRVHYEIRLNKFWKIYRSSGGSAKIRKKNFWINSIWLSFIPCIFIFATYFAVRYFKYLHFEISYWKFGVEFGLLLLIVLLSRITLGKNL